MSPRLRYEARGAEFEKSLSGKYGVIARAATLAMRDVADALKSDARAGIARAGFSKKWQNTLRVDAYPKRNKFAVNAAVFLYHKIPYAGVFETGASIGGSPLLWLPLSSAPKRLARKRTTPALFSKVTGQELVRMRSRSGRPLLGAYVRVSKTQAAKAQPKASLAALKRGKQGRGILKTIPLFVGIDRVSIRGRFRVGLATERARDQIADAYFSHFRDE